MPVTRKHISKTLGILLCGSPEGEGKGVYVASVDPNSPVGRRGLLKVGDRLLEVNGVELSGVSHLNASNLITRQTGAKVKFVVLRNSSTGATLANQLSHATKPRREDIPNDDYATLNDAVNASELAEVDVAVIKGSGAEQLVMELGGTEQASRLVSLKNVRYTVN